MRFSTSAIFAAVAIGAQALPQDVQPITQISDGQIQAPPATSAPAASYEVPSVPAATDVLPSVTPVPLPSVVPSSAPAPVEPSSAPAPVEPSSAYNTPVVPVPVGTGATSAPYPISSGAVYTNGTVLPTGAPSTSAAGEPSASGTGSAQPTEGAGGAATTFVSMGALFAGLFAFLA